MDTVPADVASALTAALRRAMEKGELPSGSLPDIPWQRSEDPAFGDLSTTVAFTLAKTAQRKPREVAEILLTHAYFDPAVVERAEVAGAGYINIFLGSRWWLGWIREILEKGEQYGHAEWGAGEKVLVEFVSANPTGPLVVVNARAAAVGDALARLLQAVGYSVEREYYINDAGAQFHALAASMEVRLRQLLGEECPLPDEAYPGEYIIDLAREFLEAHGPAVLQVSEAQRRECLGRFAVEKIVAGQRRDLERYGVTFDRWFHEQGLRDAGEPKSAVEALTAQGHTYEQDGAVWFRSTAVGEGEDKDRVLIKSDGSLTYFAADIAYHRSKMQRGFSHLIDLWGPDHHGYIPRMRAAMQALGFPPESFTVLIIQLVRLMRGGEPVRMSKRAGQFVTLAELVSEVGVDAARYIFLTRRSDSPLDFDLEVAKAQSNENPVYYVQYAYARLSSVLREAKKENREAGGERGKEEADLTLLTLPEERGLIKRLADYPQVVEGAARSFEPHRLTSYLHDLAADLHAYYNKHRILSEDSDRSRARLTLVKAMRTVIGNALGLLGVQAPERM